jgi:hypothetical protein
MGTEHFLVDFSYRPITSSNADTTEESGMNMSLNHFSLLFGASFSPFLITLVCFSSSIYCSNSSNYRTNATNDNNSIVATGTRCVYFPGDATKL